MHPDIVSIIYLIIRISPLLVVSHFVLQSILNTDSKGMSYLTGLILTCLFASTIGAVIPENAIAESNDIDCKSMGLGNLSNVSISQVTLGFTYGYLMCIILYYSDSKKENYVNTNIPTIVLFPILIFGNGLWNWKRGCSEIPILALSLVIGLGGGVAWAYMLKSAGFKHLALFNGISNKALCGQPSKARFKCVKGRNV